jgi:hypothetical protein
MELQTLKNVHFINDRSDDATFTFEDTTQFTVSTGWSTTTSDAWHIGENVEIEAEVNFIAAKDKLKVGQDFFWEHKLEKTKLGSESTSVSELPFGFSYLQYISWDTLADLFSMKDFSKVGTTTTVHGGTAVHAWAYSVQGKYDVAWEGFVRALIRTLYLPS